MRGALAVDTADQREIGAVPPLALLAAATGGVATLHLAVDLGAGAQIAERGQLPQDALVSPLTAGDVVGSGERGLPSL